MSNSIESQVIEMVAEQVHKPVAEVGVGSDLATLGADSLDRVELIMKLEEEFHIEVKDEEAEQLVTVRDLVDYVMRHKK